MTTSTASADGVPDRDVEVDAGNVTLRAMLSVPDNAAGLIVFAHGSGSGRLSPRNNTVARILQRAGLGTLLADLLTDEESRDRRLVFDIRLLAERLRCCASWAARDERTQALPVGYFGASTGAAAALVSAADPRTTVRAIVSRGGRPDLAGEALERVEAPTLLIVGSDDIPVIPLNEEALARLHCVKEMVIVLGATHLFEEPGKLEEVAALARDWFLRYLPRN